MPIAAHSQEPPDPLAERPLPPLKNALYLLLASLLVVGIYGYCLLVFLVVVALAAAPLVGAMVKSDLGILIICIPGLFLLGRTFLVFAKGFLGVKGVDDSIPLARKDAPGLWVVVEDLAKHVGVEPPQDIVLVNGVNAGVQLLGRKTGKGRSKLELGFDLLVGLTTVQARAVLAHELAHAKYVRRGYSWFIFSGLRLVAHVESGLQNLREYDDALSVASGLAGLLEDFPRKLRFQIIKLLARCLRHEEFVADRVGAEICGSHDSGEALLMGRFLAVQFQKIAWRDRLVHLNHPNGYTAWLRDALSVPSDTERLEIQARSIKFELRDALSTHPILADRIAALNSLAAVGTPWADDRLGSAIEWLRDPDRSVRKLLTEIESLAVDEERQTTRKLERDNRYLFRKLQLDPIRFCQLLIVWMLAFILVVVLLFILEASGISTKSVTFWHLGAYMLGITLLFLHVTNKEKKIGIEIPIPSLADYRRARLEDWERGLAVRQSFYPINDMSPSKVHRLNVETIQSREAKRSELGRTLRPLIPPDIVKPEAIAHFWADKGAAFLATCDYERAVHCARLAFEAKQGDLAGLLVYGIGGAFERNHTSSNVANLVWYHSRGDNVRWALAWANCLLDDARRGETYLLGLTRSKPQIPLFWALLGQCQIESGKPREALSSRRRALEEVQKNGPKGDEVYYRYDLAKSLVTLGLVDEALPEFEWVLERHQKGSLVGVHDFGLGMDWLNWHLVSRNSSPVVRLAEELANTHKEARHLLPLADLLATSPFDELKLAARSYYEQALEIGFYPNALLSLARISLGAGEKGGARRLVLEALDAGKPRPFDSVRATEVLEKALGLLLEISEAPPAESTAYQIHLDASDTPLKLKDLWLLGSFKDEETALTAGTEIFEALLPEYELEEWINVEMAEPEHQLQEPVAPGVRSFRWVVE
jgi:Zn-dependent protease with chaperone function/tetratricopeptide (TPR) repeat protein